jgi:C-terminal processing protease CtpA/Prc
MKKLTALLAGAVVLVLAVPAFAGHDGEKCSEDTQACLDQMSAKLQKKGYMGLEFDKNADGQYIIKKVMDGAPAAAAGFKTGDVILSVNETKWEDKEAMKKIDWSVGSTMAVKIDRAGKKQVLSITLAKMPDDVIARYVGAHMVENHVALAVSQKQ